MPNFIFLRGTFYPVVGEGERYYLCEAEDELLSILVVDHQAQTVVDGLAIVHQGNDTLITEKFREWIASGG